MNPSATNLAPVLVRRGELSAPAVAQRGEAIESQSSAVSKSDDRARSPVRSGP